MPYTTLRIINATQHTDEEGTTTVALQGTVQTLPHTRIWTPSAQEEVTISSIDTVYDDGSMYTNNQLLRELISTLSNELQVANATIRELARAHIVSLLDTSHPLTASAPQPTTGLRAVGLDWADQQRRAEERARAQTNEPNVGPATGRPGYVTGDDMAQMAAISAELDRQNRQRQQDNLDAMMASQLAANAVMGSQVSEDARQPRNVRPENAQRRRSVQDVADDINAQEEQRVARRNGSDMTVSEMLARARSQHPRTSSREQNVNPRVAEILAAARRMDGGDTSLGTDDEDPPAPIGPREN